MLSVGEEGVTSKEQSSVALCSTFFGQDKVLSGGVREFSTCSCHALWALLLCGRFQQALSSEIYVQAHTYHNIINFAGFGNESSTGFWDFSTLSQTVLV